MTAKAAENDYEFIRLRLARQWRGSSMQACIANQHLRLRRENRRPKTTTVWTNACL